jgi:hypothetical protein
MPTSLKTSERASCKIEARPWKVYNTDYHSARLFGSSTSIVWQRLVVRAIHATSAA